LLVEDDAGDQELTRRALQEDVLRIDLRIVNDGEQAMDYLLRSRGFGEHERFPRPDLILLDLNMPRLDGRQVLKRVRAHPDLRQLAVVVLTTSQHEEDIVRSYDLGCNSFITKPVDIGAFIKAIGEVGRYWFELVTLPNEVFA